MVFLGFPGPLGSVSLRQSVSGHAVFFQLRLGHDSRWSQVGLTLLSLKVDLDLRGYLEDLGLILGILATMVSFI